MTECPYCGYPSTWGLATLQLENKGSPFFAFYNLQDPFSIYRPYSRAAFPQEVRDRIECVLEKMEPSEQHPARYEWYAGSLADTIKALDDVDKRWRLSGR